MKASLHNLMRKRPGRGGRALRWAAAGLVALAAGCAPKYHDYQAFVKHPEPVVSATEYRMAPPDIVTISSRRVREINGLTQQISPDGKISLPLLGNVFIAGMTPEEASALLEKKAAEYYRDADVSLRVSGFVSKRIYVWGEVNAPGPYAYDGTNSVFRMLAQAQPTRLADRSHIEVLRPNENGKLVPKMTIDLDNMVEKGDLAHNALLRQNDVIWVPPNPLATVGLALQQLLLPIQPAISAVSGPAELTVQSTGRRPYGGNSTGGVSP